VVDDHRALAERLGELVERAGFRASVAFSGTAGVNAFVAAQSTNSPFSIVVTDFSMADLDGLGVAASVKASSPSTRVVLLTAYQVGADGQLPRHVDAVLTKPPSGAELRSTLTRLIAGS
jgi:CheY-like chemotaxis protein